MHSVIAKIFCLLPEMDLHKKEIIKNTVQAKKKKKSVRMIHYLVPKARNTLSVFFYISIFYIDIDTFNFKLKYVCTYNKCTI